MATDRRPSRTGVRLRWRWHARRSIIAGMRWLLRLVLLRVLGSRVMLGLAVLAWFRSALRRRSGDGT